MSDNCGKCGASVRLGDPHECEQRFLRIELDSARASEAMLRVTLSDIDAYLNDPETTIAQGDQIENVLNAIDTALSGSSGEWLERHDAEIVTAISRDKNAALARAEKAEAERDALLGNPKAVHQGALAAIEAMKQMQGNAEKIQALQNEAATAGIRLAMSEAERDRRIAELEAQVASADRRLARASNQVELMVTERTTLEAILQGEIEDGCTCDRCMILRDALAGKGVSRG